MNLYDIYTEEKLVKQERDKLDSSKFGLQKERQYPLIDEEHVRKAIQLFGKCPEGKREELAKNIYAAAQQYNVQISLDSKICKYLSDKEINNIKNSKQNLNESLIFGDFVNFRQVPINEETIEKYGDTCKELKVLSESENRIGHMLINEDKKVIGLIEVDKDTNFINKLHVDPYFRNLGLGTNLLSNMIDSLNGRLVRVKVDKNMTESVNFFRKNGFEIVNETPNFFLMENVSNLYYRFTYKNIGIYEAFRQEASPEQWKNFLNSDAAKWLPKPEIYSKGNNLASLFTKEGYDMFMKKTYPVFIKVLDKKSIIMNTYVITKDIVYSDKYQIVVQSFSENKILTESLKPLSPSLKALDLHSNEASSYIEKDSYLGNLKKKNELKSFKGEVIVDTIKTKVVGRILVGTGRDEGFIGALRVLDEYQGQGLGYRLLDDAVKKYGGVDLTVVKDNKVAYNMYIKYGFVVIKELKEEYWMKLKSKLNKNEKIITISESSLSELASVAGVANVANLQGRTIRNIYIQDFENEKGNIRSSLDRYYEKLNMEKGASGFFTVGNQILNKHDFSGEYDTIDIN